MIILKEKLVSEDYQFVMIQIGKILTAAKIEYTNAMPSEETYIVLDVLGQEIVTKVTALLEDKLKKWGWFITGVSPVSNNHFHIYIYSSKGVKAFSRENTPNYLYHLTPPENEKSILKYGIKPSTTWSQYGRVYLATDLKTAKKLGDVFLGRFSNSPYIIIKVDTTKFIANYYIDNDYEKGGIWTPTHIPANAIEVIK